MSPYGAENVQNDHEMYGHVGEPFDKTIITDELRSYDGLLNNVRFINRYESFIKVTFFYDEDEDGIKDPSEFYMNIGAFVLQDSLLFRNSFKEGVTLAAKHGAYTLAYSDVGAIGWDLSTQASHQFTLDDNNTFKEISFGLVPNEDYVEVNTFICNSPLRCSRKVDYHMVALNEGYVPASGTVWLKIDPRLSGVVYVDEPDIVIDSNYVGWFFELQPTERQEYYYCLQAPSISDSVMVGEQYKTISWVNDNVLDQHCLEEILRCSYDPNDKLVNPNRPDSLGLIEDEIIYTIRFQNTGNDYADDVVVTDTLSEYLDMSTFKLINTSHPREFTLVNDVNDDHILNFTFRNIFLPDSTTNEPGSHGFIMYKIKPYPDVDINTEINNTGYIYFDFNPAIVTNTTSTTLVDEFPVGTVELSELEVQVSPNPSTGIFHLDKRVDKVMVYDLSGRMLRQLNNLETIDLQALDSGTYILDIWIGQDHGLEKVVILD